jgi:hypothetical protein
MRAIFFSFTVCHCDCVKAAIERRDKHPELKQLERGIVAA